MLLTHKFLHRSSRHWVAVTAVVALVTQAPCFGQTSATAAARKKGLQLMQSVAERFSVHDTKRREHKLHNEPIFRYGGTARGWNDGTIWVFGKKKRPALLMTVAVEDGEFTVEASSLSEKPIVFDDGEQESWSPDAPAVAFAPIKGMRKPSTNKRQRGIQLKQIAKTFNAYEYWYTEDRSQGKQRFQLRLVPQPVWRYKDEAAHIVDGAIFLYCYGTNPEVIGLIETRSDESGELTWQAGFTRSAGADLFVFREGEEFWKPPARDARGAYTNFSVVAPRE